MSELVVIEKDALGEMIETIVNRRIDALEKKIEKASEESGMHDELSPYDVYKEYGVSKRTQQKWRDLKLVPFERRGPRLIYYKRKDLLAYFNKQ